MSTPFSLSNATAYQRWRDDKLQTSLHKRSHSIPTMFIDIDDPCALSQTEKQAILQQCKHNNYCLYRIKQTNHNNKKSIHSLALSLGLRQLDNNLCADPDSLTSITHTSHSGQHAYIPYSTKRLSWHTDGYYNTPERRINAMLLHCATPAQQGGETLLMDHEIAYLLLRDENPAYIEALMQDDALTIPANIIDGKTIREAQTGPVFFIDNSGKLQMRYSARKRNIEWKQTPPILKAIEFLENLLESDSPFIKQYTLHAGEGLICNNVLHRRTAFVDNDDPAKKRLLYRGRYLDSITTV